MGKNLMPKDFLIIVLLLLAAAFIGAGCAQRSVEKEDLLAVEPNIAVLVIPGDYAAGAIGATGGLETWAKTIKLDFDGVVTYYHPDNSFSLTEHSFEVYPWSSSIRISAQEPQSKFVWQLSAAPKGVLRRQFCLLEGNKAADISSRVISNRDYAEALLIIITAPVRFLDKTATFLKSPAPIKIEGLWYYPIEQTYPVQMMDERRGTRDEGRRLADTPVVPVWSKVVFFQNIDTSLIDMIWFANSEKNSSRRRALTEKSAVTSAEPERDKFLAVRGYDYKKIHENGVLAPSKIEIFRADDKFFLKERLVTIDFKMK